MSLLALLMGWIVSWWLIQYWNQPLDYGIYEQVSTQEVEQPYLTGWASWYDYKLWGKRWSKTHNTCALRIYERYQTFKVCSKATWKCVECYHNDYWPKEYTNKIIDLSSHAFKELWIPLSRGVAEVEIYLVDDKEWKD